MKAAHQISTLTF